ncbi:hypothetical protein QMK17_05935 [Rhodococcus sp. G-MC3]|uniref:hypothetical protein n=1 Tax=Rhodococcus sp. G-MC3 TaxID=3046209 RepID=UPI0024B93A09|nr:hypothetical protein [Rhodococcus sp. G-MC3]MDJ0392868.1 hypothetical protein [Rhodococcus sp. G-MC3]
MITPRTVASVPTAHAYVSHLEAVHGRPSATRRLPDPVPSGADGTDRWWPPRWLDPEWLEAHVEDIDLLHLHFGFDSLPVEQLEQVVGVLRAHAIPLVFTVHDLHNPHFEDNALHTAHLDVLVRAADELITLTPGAAAELLAIWDVSATVIPHPHVAPLNALGRPRERSTEFVIGMHAKNLRANLDPLAVLDTVVETASALPNARVRIDVDATVFDDPRSDSADIGRALLRYRSSLVDVRVHPRFDDAELWQYLTEIDVSILPYRFGTHSGWLEACHDLGVAAVVPDCGYFAEQRDCHTFGFGIGRFDSVGLSDAVNRSYDARFDVSTVTRAARELERTHIAQRHDEIYARATARTFASAGDNR